MFPGGSCTNSGILKADYLIWITFVFFSFSQFTITKTYTRKEKYLNYEYFSVAAL